MFSLKSLLFIVAVAALGAAGLLYRNQVWASTLVALTLGVLLFAVFSAWFTTSQRPFWGPFALTGIVYLAIVSLPPLVEMHYNLPTTQLVVYGLEKLQTPTPLAQPGYYGAPITPSTAYYVTPGMPSGISYGQYDVELATSNEAGLTAETTSSAQNSTPPPATAPAPPAVSIATSIPPPVYAPAPQFFTYPRSALFQMATTRTMGDGFPVEARAFLWVAQCLWTLLLAFAAGMACSWFFRNAAA